MIIKEIIFSTKQIACVCFKAKDAEKKNCRRIQPHSGIKKATLHYLIEGKSRSCQEEKEETTEHVLCHCKGLKPEESI